jgi:hypothetical protein
MSLIVIADAEAALRAARQAIADARQALVAALRAARQAIADARQALVAALRAVPGYLPSPRICGMGRSSAWR